MQARLRGSDRSRMVPELSILVGKPVCYIGDAPFHVEVQLSRSSQL